MNDLLSSLGETFDKFCWPTDEGVEITVRYPESSGAMIEFRVFGERRPYQVPLDWMVNNVKHVCHTADGKEIKMGLRVIDYDCRQGTVTGVPSRWDLDDEVCWPTLGHGGHWWEVTPDDAPEGSRGGSFDGSRMTTRGVK